MRAALALFIVAACGWMTAKEAVGVHHSTAAQRYPVDFGAGAWIQAAGSAERTYFRTTFELAALPDRAVLWLQADQEFVLRVNGTSSVASNQAAVRANRPPEAVPVDITSHLRVGTNVIGVDVSNFDYRPAAMRARLEITVSSITTTLLTSGRTWRATSDAALVSSPRRSGSLQFGQVGFNASAWPPALRRPGPNGVAFGPIPEALLTTPLGGEVLAAPSLASDAVIAGTVSIPAAATSTWVEVAATGPFSLLLDGRVLDTASAAVIPHTSPPVNVLAVIATTGAVEPGDHRIAVHVQNPSGEAGAYVQVESLTARGIEVAASDTNWSAAGSALASGTTPAALGPPAAVFAALQQELVTLPDRVIPARTRLDVPLLAAVGLVLLSLVSSALLAWRRPGRFAEFWGADAAAHLPIWLSAVAYNELRRISAVPDGPIPWALPMALTVGLVLTKVGAAWWTARSCKRGTTEIEVVPAELLAAPKEPGPDKSESDLSVDPELRPEAAEPEADRALDPEGHTEADGPPAVPSPPPEADPVAQAPPVHAKPTWRVRIAVLFAGRLPPRLAVLLVAAVCGAAMSYDIGYEPLWQDELTSLLVAKSMRAHGGIPELPSGLMYFKAELYHLLIAGLGMLLNDNTNDLRLVSVGWYVGTVLVFGLVFVPTLLPGRRWAPVIITALFASAPQELVWARQLRMYQQEQFFAVAFLAALAIALRRNRTRDIVTVSLLLVVMYLSHEESFILFPAVAVAFLGFRRLSWVKDWRWWIIGGSALAIIGGQYVLSGVHPPIFGTDVSNKPYVGYDVSQFWYYYSQVYFNASAEGASLATVSCLSVIASIVGIRRRDFARLYLTIMLWVSFLALSAIFTARSDRYTFVTLPILFALAGMGGLDLMDWVRHRLSRTVNGTTVRAMAALTVVPAFVALATTLPGRLSDYGVAAARLTGATITQAYADYAPVGAVLRRDIRPGDLFVTLAPPVLPAYYAGRAPDMIIATGRNKLLYLMERHGEATDTIWGAPTILTAADLQTVMQEHRRVWVFTDRGPYLSSVPTDIKTLILDDFQEVAEDNTTALYLWHQ
jgi:hypothetical protein